MDSPQVSISGIWVWNLGCRICQFLKDKAIRIMLSPHQNMSKGDDPISILDIQRLKRTFKNYQRQTIKGIMGSQVFAENIKNPIFFICNKNTRHSKGLL